MDQCRNEGHYFFDFEKRCTLRHHPFTPEPEESVTTANAQARCAKCGHEVKGIVTCVEGPNCERCVVSPCFLVPATPEPVREGKSEAQRDGEGIGEVLRAMLHEHADKIADEIASFAVALLQLNERRHAEPVTFEQWWPMHYASIREWRMAQHVDASILEPVARAAWNARRRDG